jgi:hypothetical protein
VSWLFAAVAVLVAVVGLVRRALIPRSGAGPRVDDDAVRRILHSGTLGADEEPLDMEAAARAEEAFFDEPWDEPEEMHP